MNHRQLKPAGVNTPKRGEHESPRGLLRQQERFHTASTLTSEISTRNHSGLREMTLVLILCPFNGGEGPGSGNIGINELCLAVFHLGKGNKDEKRCLS